MAEKQYAACRIRKRYLSSEQFIKVNPSQIREKMLKVIETEGPVLDDLMQLRVLKSYGIAKRGSSIQPFLDRIMDSIDCFYTEQTDYMGKIHRVFWPEGLRPESYDDYRPSCDERVDITDYPEEEIANIFKAALSDNPSLQGEDLVRDVLGRLGFCRKGAALDATLNKVMQGLGL